MLIISLGFACRDPTFSQHGYRRYPHRCIGADSSFCIISPFKFWGSGSYEMDSDLETSRSDRSQAWENRSVNRATDRPREETVSLSRNNSETLCSAWGHSLNQSYYHGRRSDCILRTVTFRRRKSFNLTMMKNFQKMNNEESDIFSDRPNQKRG